MNKEEKTDSSYDSDDEEIDSQVCIKNRMHMSGFYPAFCKIDLTQ